MWSATYLGEFLRSTAGRDAMLSAVSAKGALRFMALIFALSGGRGCAVVTPARRE